MGRSSARIDQVLARLADGPATAAELAEVLYTHTGDVSRMMSQLRMKGRVRRVDNGSGRGSIALYGLPEVPATQTAGARA